MVGIAEVLPSGLICAFNFILKKEQSSKIVAVAFIADDCWVKRSLLLLYL